MAPRASRGAPELRLRFVRAVASIRSVADLRFALATVVGAEVLLDAPAPQEAGRAVNRFLLIISLVRSEKYLVL